jgi:hypothetical protein
VIGLLVERQVPYTEAEAGALVAEAKTLAKESGRTVRAEAETLLSRDRETQLRDLRHKVEEATHLLAAIITEVDDLWAESGDDDGNLADLLATMVAACEPFTSAPPGGSTSTEEPGAPRARPVTGVAPAPTDTAGGAHP